MNQCLIIEDPTVQNTIHTAELITLYLPCSNALHCLLSTAIIKCFDIYKIISTWSAFSLLWTIAVCYGDITEDNPIRPLDPIFSVFHCLKVSENDTTDVDSVT